MRAKKETAILLTKKQIKTFNRISGEIVKSGGSDLSRKQILKAIIKAVKELKTLESKK